MGADAAVRIVLVVCLGGSGILLIWMAVAAASGRLKRNSLAGIRLPVTMASDEAWLAAHVRSLRPTVCAGIASLASGLSALLPVPAPILAAVVLSGVGVMLGCALYGARVGSRAARDALDSAGG